jgi:hypothetical protein
LPLQTYYAKHLTCICSVSIVKREHLLLSIFLGTLHKQKKKKKGKRENVKKSKEILEENKKQNINKKSILEHLRNRRRLVEEDQVCKIEKFDSIFFN